MALFIYQRTGRPKKGTTESIRSVFVLYNSETKELQREIVQSTDERYLELDMLPSCKKGIAMGLLSFNQINKLASDEWKQTLLGDVEEWANNIAYYIHNESHQEFLMLPCTADYKKKVREGILVKMDTINDKTRHKTLKEYTKACVLQPNGEVINAYRDKVTLSPDIVARLVLKYAMLVEKAKSAEDVSYAKLFPFRENDIKQETQNIQKYLNKKEKSNPVFVARLMKSIRKAYGDIRGEHTKYSIGNILCDYFDRRK